MSDIGAGGTIDYSNLPNFTVRGNSNATDIRRTVAPVPTQIGNNAFTGTTTTTAAAAFGKTFTTLNSGALFFVSAGTDEIHIGITAPGLTTADCVTLKSDFTKEVFIPAKDLNDIIIIPTGNTTLSMIGE